MLLTVNRGGDSVDNPLLAGLSVTFRAHIHGDETLWKAWVTTADGSVVLADLSARLAKESGGYSATTWAVIGTDVPAEATPTRYRFHFSTNRWSLRRDFWTAARPAHEVELDGYDASDPGAPLILAVCG